MMNTHGLCGYLDISKVIELLDLSVCSLYAVDVSA